MFRIILASTLFFLLHCSVLAQTPGMIVQPATGPGPSIFDPNGDGYVSQNNQGFISDDQTESEIPFTSLIFPGTEPIGDINNGPNCGFTDFVDQGDRDPAQKYLSPAGNWLFRLRLGGIAPNAKSYSILIDTDGLFGNTGSYADPNYTLSNPGFEIEIVLATHFGVFVYDVQNTTPNCTPVISYPGTTHYQKSIAGSTNCNDPDYFYDFYVVFADLASHFGITTSTLMRYVIVDNMAAQASTVCQPNSASDVGGVGNCPNLAACFQTIINYQGFCSPNTSNCTERSLCPGINAPINSGATSVSGTSTEPNGTTIRVYKNNVLIGTTTLSSGVWTLSSISPALASNDVITATAQAPNEYVSEALCDATTVGSTCTNAPLTAQLSTISGNKGIRITLTAGTLAPGSLIYMYNPDGTLFNPSVLIAGAVNPITTVAGTNIYNFECQTGQCFPSGTYYISFQQPGQCESSQTPYCFNTSASTQIPTVTTSPILDNLSSISGTVPAPDDVAGVSINVYVNGFIQAIATSGAGGAWTATGLNLNPCDTIRVQGSGSGKCYSALSSNYLVSGGTTATPTVTGNYCTSGTISSVTGVSSEANGTLITLFLNGVSSGTTTLSNGAFTFTGLSINSGTSIYVRAQAACKSQSSNSNTVTVTSLSSSAGLSLTTNPVLEGASTLSGTGTNGNTVQVLIDGYPVGNSVTVTGGVWTVSGIQSFELYANGALTLTTTSGANCASAPITAGVVLCNIPSQNLSVTPDSILFCGNSTVGSISIANAQSSVIYQLTNQAGTNIGSSVLGTGSTITLSTGTLNASGIVKVKALKLPPTCQSFQLDTIVVILNPTPSLSLGVSSQNPVVCTGTSTNVIVANSQSGFTYQLRNNANNALIGSPISGNGNNLSLPTGNLTNNTTFNILATGTSPTSCSGQLSQTVTVTVTNTPNAPTLGTITQPTCGTPSGSVVISSPASGTGFEYAIDNGSFQASNAFSGIAAGNHQFTVRPNGSTCVSAQTPVTINAVPSLPATPSVTLTQPTCATPTGTIAFTTQAGVQYGVNGTFQAGASFAGLAPGNYTIAVRSTTDNTCITNGTAQTINAVPSLPATPSVTLTQPTCATPTGTIAFTTQAGVQYGVNGTFQAGASFAGLAPGNYTIAVRSTTDNTCITNGTAQTINAVPSLPATPSVTLTQPTCATPTGTIAFTTQAGVQYGVNGTFQAGASFAGLAPGNYTIAVQSTTDNTCVTNGTAQTINAVPSLPATPSVTLTQPTCATPTGTIAFTTQAGVQYGVNGTFQAGASFAGLAPGNYTIAVRSTTDNTCITNGTAQTINAVPSLPATPSVTLTQPTCATPTGTIAFTTQAGVQYGVNGTFQAGASFAGLAPGNYTIAVRSTTDNTCVTNGTAQTINAVPSLPATPSVTLTQPTCASPTGTIAFTTQAGVQYGVNGTFQAGASFAGLAPGNYTIAVRSTTDNTCITNGTAQTINAVPSLPATPSVTLTQPTCATPTGTIAFTTQAGVQYGVNGTFQAGASFAGLAPGNYTIAVRSTTDNTCVTIGTAQTINAVPSLPATPSVTLTQPTCATPTGTIAFTTQAGVQYGVNGTFQAGASFAGLAPGNYTIAVRSSTDNTCVTNGTVQTINAVPSCPPTANNDSGSGNEDSPVTLPSVQGNDVDTNGNVITNTIDLDPNTPGIQGSYTSTNGTWSVNPITGNVVFTPNSNFNGTESISYTIQDNSGLTSNNATLSVTLSPVNDAPIALNDLANTNEDTPVTITVIQNDSDVDGTINPGSVSVTTNPSNGTFTINPTTGAITYTPNPNFNGTDSLVYQVCDNGTPMPAQCDFATVIFNVTPINDPPIANNDLATTNEDTPITVNVLGNDTDLDGSIVPSTVNVLTAPNHGTVTINPVNGAITYTPSTNFNGTDSLVYQVCDNGTPLPSQCDVATLYFTVTPVNDPPVTDNENINLNEDGSFSGDLTDIGDFDPDSTNLVCAPTPGFGPFHGTIVINSNGTYTYTPNQNYFGPDTVVIEVCDNGLPLPGLCTYDTIFINVNAVNDAPIANQDNANTFEGNQVSLTLLANDLDIDGTIDVSSGTIITNGANGNATLSNGILTYIPNPGFTGNDTITYQICDNGIPVLCDTAIVLINVLPCLNNPNADCDGDGVINSVEILDGTDPSNGCSLVIASQTLIPSNAWIQSDCDGDGVDNGTEGLNNTNPLNPCSYLAANQTLPTSPSFNQLDCDGDGVVNIDEIDPDGDGIPGPNGTDPQNSCSLNIALISVAVDTLWSQSDCDGDGVTNGDEIDPDGDGFIGPNETNPTDPCSLLLTNQSLAPNTAWLNLDCDGDGVNNGLEVDPDGDGTPGPNGTDPQNPCSLTLANQNQTPSAAWYSLDCDGDGVTNEDEIDPDGDGIPGPNGTDPSNPCALDLANLSLAPSQNWLDSDCDGDGVSNGDEIDPNGDGIPGPNGTDILNPCSYNPADQTLSIDSTWYALDCDGDGVSNGDEIDPDGDGTPGPDGTNPNDPCSYALSSQSIAPSAAWLLLDCDGDGVSNGTEIDPNGDGIPGPNGTNPSDPCSLNILNQTLTPSASWQSLDCDGDGVTNSDELDPDGDGTPGPNGTNPIDPCSLTVADITLTIDSTWATLDCDGDGVTNGDEIDPDGDGMPGPNGTDLNDPCSYLLANQSGTPSNAWNFADCDGDGVTNESELNDGTDPLNPCEFDSTSITLTLGINYWNADCDDDGLTNGDEDSLGTDLNDADTDGDGINDGDEINGGSDPLDPCDPNPTLGSCGSSIFIPEAFTPDGDNTNEYFEIVGIENYPNNTISIYNRWGNLVYQTENYQNQWSGVANVNLVLGNDPLPTGTYYYILDLNGDGQEIYKGSVYIKR